MGFGLSLAQSADCLGVPSSMFIAMVIDGAVPEPKGHLWTPEELEFVIRMLPTSTRKPRPPQHPWREYADVGGVYFAGFRDYLKIGVSSRIGTRLLELSTATPERLTLYGIIAGATAADERAIHLDLHQHRLHGEWFRMNTETTLYIRRHRSTA